MFLNLKKTTPAALAIGKLAGSLMIADSMVCRVYTKRANLRTTEHCGADLRPGKLNLIAIAEQVYAGGVADFIDDPGTAE